MDSAPKVFKNKKLILIISIILGIIAMVIMYRVINITEVIKTLKNTTISLILYYVLIQIIMMIILTWRWKVILKSQGVDHISTVQLNKYRLVGQGVSYMTPSGKLGGEPIRAGLLSSQENIDFNKSLSSVVIDRAIDITTAMLFFVFGMFIMLFVFVTSPIFADVVIVVSLFILCLLLFFNYRMLKGKKVFHHVFLFFRLDRIKRMKKTEKMLNDVETLIIKFYHEDTKYFYQAAGISLLTWVLMFFEFKVVGLMVGENLTPVQSFLIFSFIGAAYIVPVPMALGALEAGQISAFSIMGINAAAGLALSFLVRLKDVIIALIGIVYLGIYGITLKETVKETKYLDKELNKLKQTGSKVNISKLKNKKN